MSKYKGGLRCFEDGGFIGYDYADDLTANEDSDIGYYDFGQDVGVDAARFDGGIYYDVDNNPVGFVNDSGQYQSYDSIRDQNSASIDWGKVWDQGMKALGGVNTALTVGGSIANAGRNLGFWGDDNEARARALARSQGRSPMEDAAGRLAIIEFAKSMNPQFAKSGAADRMSTISMAPVVGSFANGGGVQGAGGLGQTRAMYVKGGTPGQADTVDARLSHGEYVFDADTVAALGDGNSEAGASVLNKMRENIRKHKRSAPADKIPPKAKAPEAYLPKKGAK